MTIDRQNWRRNFDLDQRVWLNNAHQGVLPSSSAEAARRAIEWKMRPWELSNLRFTGIPQSVREGVGALLGIAPDQVILANGASYGVHLLANGLPLDEGDEVLLMAGDFPSNVLPWQGLEDKGVIARVLEPAGTVLEPWEVEAAIGPKTRVVFVSWVHSFSGQMLDIEAIAEICRSRGVLIGVNITQGFGARPLALQALDLDAVVCAGWKWLMGPYATGFCWLGRRVLEQIRYNQSYWLSGQTEASLRGNAPMSLPDRDVPRRYDIFAPANFFHYAAFGESLRWLGEIGLQSVEAAVQESVGRVVDELGRGPWELKSTVRGPNRSSLIVFSHCEAERNQPIYEGLAAAGIDLALRRGQLRLSPHFYNTPDEIERALDALQRLA